MLLMLGIILGPLYYAYGVYASGNIAETFSMVDRAERWTAPDGTILRFRGGLGFRPQPLNLTPEMNEVKLRLRFAIPKEAVGNLGDMRYQATLLEYDHTILERSFVLNFGRNGKANADVGPLEISYQGAYIFLLEEVGAAPISPEITLEVIQEVRRPLMPLVWGGLGLLVLALLLALYDLVSAVRKQRPFQ